MTAPRIVVAGATTALTRRTTLRKAFLAPWHPLVEDCWLYSLADAQRQTGVEVHHSVLVVSHHHTDVTPVTDNLPEFTRRFHRDLSCALHALLCQERYDAPRELFDDRPTHTMRLLDAAAQASHLVYEYLNPSAAGLVQRPEHMPLRTLDFGLWKTGYIEVDRPPVYFDSSRPEKLRLYLTPPPLLYRAFGGDLERLIHHMNRLAEDGLRAVRAARKGPVLGAKGVERIHPWNEPRTMRESGGNRVPSFRIGARGIVARRARIEAATEVRSFRNDYRDCRLARRDGDHERPFPFGTYAMRVYHGASVQPEPPPGAQVAQPGPLLPDVKRELGEIPDSGLQGRDGTRTLVAEVREALLDEAGDIVEDAELDLTDPKPVLPARSRGEHDADDWSTAPAAVVVRHRFDKSRPPPAPRLITLRDRRRGRPPRGTGPHGADPPT